jgi:hypothetical protein
MKLWRWALTSTARLYALLPTVRISTARILGIRTQLRSSQSICLSNGRIIKACYRKRLAETALYAYPKGEKVVTGPSIRLAEVMAQNWGNMDFGIREITQTRGAGSTLETVGESVCQAFCWDTEHNVKQEKTFTVPHWRHTKQGGYALKDPRDIYELIANQGARRLRACILGVIPGWAQDEAVQQVNVTLANNAKEPLEDRAKNMVAAFHSSFGVTLAMVEKKIGHKIDAIQEAEMVSLRATFQSLKDGMAKPGAFFEDMIQNHTTTEGKAGDLNAGFDEEDNSIDDGMERSYDENSGKK